MKRAMVLMMFVAAGCGAAQRCEDVATDTSVETHELELVDSSRATMANGSYSGASSRTLKTTLWLPAGKGPHPLIVHSHGFSDTRGGESYLTEFLARAGYAVAALDFPLSNFNAPGGPTVFDIPQQPGDVAFVIEQLLAGQYASRLDPMHVGLSGLSLGGLTTLLATYHATLAIPNVRAAFVMAPVSCFFTEAFFARKQIPLGVAHGDNDILIPYPEHGRRVFDRAKQRGMMATLIGGTHLGFTNLGASTSPTSHPDGIGCAFIPSGPPMFSGIGGNDVGISTGECPVSCQGQGTVPALEGIVQQELTQYAARAFFDRYLLGKGEASCVLKTVEALDVETR